MIYADHAPRIVLAYDVDAAGQRAGTFGVARARRARRAMASDNSGVELDEVRVARLPDGKDPDEVIRESADTLEGRHRPCPADVDYLIDQAAEARDLRTPAAGKAASSRRAADRGRPAAR